MPLSSQHTPQTAEGIVSYRKLDQAGHVTPTFLILGIPEPAALIFSMFWRTCFFFCIFILKITTKQNKTKTLGY